MSEGPPVTVSGMPSRSGMVRTVGRLRGAGCVFAEDEARLLIAAAGNQAELDAMVDRRTSGIPLEHILGWVWFCGRRIAVEPGVFVPRRRTEFLVRRALVAVRAAGRDCRGEGRPATVVVDMCCGSGAVGAALASALRHVELHCVDIDPTAVRCARRNIPGGRVYEGDLVGPLPARLRGRVDVLVANAPYVPTARIDLMPPEARIHEPRVALDGGADGLDVLRRVVSAAPEWLAPGGRLLFETSEGQLPKILEEVAHSGLLARVARSGATDSTVVDCGRENEGDRATIGGVHIEDAVAGA